LQVGRARSFSGVAVSVDLHFLSYKALLGHEALVDFSRFAFSIELVWIRELVGLRPSIRRFARKTRRLFKAGVFSNKEFIVAGEFIYTRLVGRCLLLSLF